MNAREELIRLVDELIRAALSYSAHEPLARIAFIAALDRHLESAAPVAARNDALSEAAQAASMIAAVRGGGHELRQALERGILSLAAPTATPQSQKEES